MTSPSEFALDQPLPYRDAASQQRRHRPSAKATRSDAFAPSPLPRLHTQHSRCRCGTSDPQRNYVTRLTTPSTNTSISSPTSNVVNIMPHRRSSSHTNLTNGQKFTLRDLVQQNMPERKEDRSSLQSSRKQREFGITISPVQVCSKSGWGEDKVLERW